MATAYNLGTFRNAIKPVGEEIVIDYNNTTVLAAADSVSWVYDLPANVVVTDVMIVKTGSALDGADQVSLTFEKVNQAGVETVLWQYTSLVGVLETLGRVTRPTTAFLPGSTTGSLENRLMGIKANNNVAGTPNSSQQLKVTLDVIADSIAANAGSYLIKISLSRFSSVSSKFDEVVTVEG